MSVKVMVSSLLLSSSFAFANPEKITATALDQTLKLEVNSQGLQEIAAYINQTSLADIDNMALPDVNDTVDGVEVKASGLHLWATFGDTNLVAHTDELQAVQQIIQIRVKADSIRMRKKVVGNWVSTTCDDTEIVAGQSETVQLDLKMNTGVSGRRIVLSERSTDFSIPSSQYDVNGPRRCSGALGVGSLIRLVAQSVLKNSRGSIEDAVENKIKDLIPTVADNINNTIIRRFEIDLNQAPLPASKAVALTYPYAVSLRPSSLAVTIGTELRSLAQIEDPKEEIDTEEDFTPSGLDIGAAGLNPTIITEAFKTVFPRGTPWQNLDGENTPGLGDALDVSTAAGIWPDLNEIQLSSRKLHVAVRLAAAPIIAVNAQNSVISVEIPSLELMFKIQQNGQWRDYFIIRINLRSGLSITKSGQRLVLSLAGPKSLRVTGNWAPGYVPSLDIFEADVAELIFKSLVDFLYSSGPLTRFDIPGFAIGNSTVNAGAVALRNPYINVQLIKN
jgi:hypothetical protein